MSINKYCTYTYDLDGETLPLPFNPDGDPEHEYLSANGLHAVLAFLVRDDCPRDPFDDFDEGEFYQFDRSYKHNAPRPDVEEFKRIVRRHPGQVVTVDRCGDGYRAGELVTLKDCRGDKRTGENSRAEQLLDDADGYYIVPEDATNPFEYAQGSIKTYSQWCSGDVYGVIVWEYTRESIADRWEDPDREECWGYYGYDGYTAEELKAQFINAVTHGDPSKEATTL
jgi:hypothetical protein